jgi:Carboxypeptidase regulatory-like domain
MRMILLLGFLAAQAWGCSCSVSPTGDPPCQSAWRYGAVFTGMVTEITDPGLPISPPDETVASPLPFPQRKVRIRITEVLARLDPNQQEIVIETGMGGGDCGYGFRRGLDYIVYASKKPGGTFSTGICSPTRLVETAAEYLKYFHQLAHSSPAAEIRVTAFDVHESWGNRRDGLPQMAVLEGARVTIDGPGVHESAATDAAGRHIFSGLPPGEYKMDASLEGYATTRDPSRPIQVHAKGCAEVPLPLQLDRKVSGVILTQDGLPAAGVTVEAVPNRPRHESDLPLAADSSTTDMDGRYELRHLTTGDYYLGISLSRSPTLQNPYTRWFYPGTEDPATAGILYISDKAEVLRFDLTLPVPQHDRVIQGVVFWPDGRLAEGVNIFLEDPRWTWQTSNIAATTDKQGRFTAHALDGTRYRIHAATVASGRVSAEPVRIDTGGIPLDLKLVLTRKGYSPRDGIDKGLDDWRKGFGLR